MESNQNGYQISKVIFDTYQNQKIQGMVLMVTWTWGGGGGGHGQDCNCEQVFQMLRWTKKVEKFNEAKSLNVTINMTINRKRGLKVDKRMDRLS